MTIRRGFDVSNWSGRLDTAALERMKQLGFDFCIPGTQVGADGNGYTRAQIQTCRAAGIEVPAVYCFLYWDAADAERIDYARRFGLPVWLDCEYATAGRPPETIVASIDAAVGRLGSQVAGIYTGAWWWRPATADSTRFAALPLWHAAYAYGDRPPPDGYTPDFDAFSPYGGWQRPSLWQYANNAPTGLNADLDAWEAAMAPAPALSAHDGPGAIMVRHNAIAARFEKTVVAGRSTVSLAELGLPESVRMLRVEVFKEASGTLYVIDGADRYAGSLSAAYDDRHAVIDVVPSAGQFLLDGGEGVTVVRLGVLGYWE